MVARSIFATSESAVNIINGHGASTPSILAASNNTSEGEDVAAMTKSGMVRTAACVSSPLFWILAITSNPASSKSSLKGADAMGSSTAIMALYNGSPLYDL